MGAGAVGSYIGAFLSREGHDVTLIDMWAPHVDAMNENGIRVSGTQGDFTVPVKAVHMTEAQKIKDPFDIAFLAVKSYDTEWATHFINRFVSLTGVVVSAQNCMNDHLIASIVGHHREVGCVMSGITVALWEPGHVTRGGQPGRGRGHDVFRVGELHGRITARVEELADLLGAIDAARPTSNIWGERWSKLTTNASSNPVIALAGMGSKEVAQLPQARWIQTHIAKESVQVGRALGYEIEPISGVPAERWADADRGDVFEELDALSLARGGGLDWKSSMAQDVTKGRRTEIDYMNGLIVEQGRAAGIPTPVNSATVETVRGIDAGLLSPDPSNIDRLVEAASA
jgi:2-dehydropantoate 2-reductase